MRNIDKLLKTVLRQSRGINTDLTNEELDAEIARLEDELGLPTNTPIDYLMRRMKEVYESMTLEERRLAAL